MSARSRGFWSGIFGRGSNEAETTSLFPAREPRDPPPAALPPAQPPGIIIEPPRPDRPPVAMPRDVPPPAPPPTGPVTRQRAAPEPTAAPALPPPAAGTRAARPTVLASVLEQQPALPPPQPAAPPSDASISEQFAELAELPTVPTTAPGFWGGQLPRLSLAPAAVPPLPLPLVEGSERFTNDFVINWHLEPRPVPPRDVACSFATDAIVTGPGHIWLDGKLVTSQELMPGYVYKHHGFAEAGGEILGVHALPLREIAAPCVVLVGHGLHVYGHFIIELLFRVLLVQRMLRGSALPPPRWLLDESAPAWLMTILHEDLGVPADQIEMFRPGDERVRLRQAILPGLLHHDDWFHPFASDLLDELLARLSPLPEPAPAPAPAPRLFLARRGFRNRRSSPRQCLNEEALIALAAERGFVPIAAEELPWREQLALFRNAEILVGPFGSALHTAMVAPAGTRIGSLGLLNMTQSQIASLRGHRMAYMTEGFRIDGEFTVPEDEFVAFLDVLGAPGRQRPAPPVAEAAPRLVRTVLAAAAPPPPPAPLLPGTENFALGSQRTHHREPRPLPPREAAFYVAEDLVVGAAGLAWPDGSAFSAPDLPVRALPPEAAAAAAALPVREIAEPCIVITGPGSETFHGFVADLLPRLLLARHATAGSAERPRLLLDAAAPPWIAGLLRSALGEAETDLERFAPQTERVRLRRALLPGALHGEGGYHPLTETLLRDWLAGLSLPDVAPAERLLMQRPLPPGAPADAPRSDCRNEAALVALAQARHGFVPIVLDALPWRERLARLRAAQVVLIGPGAPLPTLLFAPSGTRVGAIAQRGPLLAEFGALRGHRMGYFSEGVPPKGPFTVQEDRFAEFLAALCAPE